MKKLFAILGISVMSFCAFLGGTRNRQVYVGYAENESSQVESSSEPQESSNENESVEPININEETQQVVSDTANDIIQVIKTIFNQPIIIGGVSVTLGALILFVFGKVFTTLLAKRNSKYDKKIQELLEQIGIDKETIAYLKGELDKLEPIIKEMIESTKNIQIKTKLLEMYNENKEIIENQAQEYIEKVEKNTNDTTQETIEKLLGK